MHEKGKLKLSQQAIDARRAYQKQWRDKNPDKVKARNARYWERRAARLAAEREQEHEQTAGN